MNILFYTRFYPNPNFGGVERVTSVLGTSLSKLDHNVYCAIPSTEKTDDLNTPFQEIVNLDLDPMTNFDFMLAFLSKKNIDIIVSQYSTDPYNNLFIRLKQFTGVKLVVAYHFAPNCDSIMLGQHLIKPLFGATIVSEFKRYVKVLLKPLYLDYYIRRSSQCLTKYSYDECDSFVLLSTRFIDSFVRIYDIKNEQKKLMAISNPLSWNYFATRDEIVSKEHTVLIVARHEEFSKRLFLALKIWSKIEKDNSNDWNLILVGQGDDTENYKAYAKQLGLKRVEFVGAQSPQPYYKHASIHMMTSSFEGFGITLTEAQQMGVVPIAFDTFDSVHDIIKHHQTGVLVPNNDVECYVNELLLLMNDKQYRERIALHGVESCKQFAQDNITSQWGELFENLVCPKKW